MTSLQASLPLPDRAAVTARLECAVASGARTSVLLVDVDGFRDVNAALGRAAGDELIAQLASRLRAAARECDAVGHDRSFIDGVAHPDAAAVVEAIISMGTKLGLVLTAEGVETREHAERLRVLGCPLGQGYMLARPMPAEHAGGLLAERLQMPVAVDASGRALDHRR